VVTPDVNASFGRAGWRRRPVLAIGLPLWNVLTPAHKLALLGHELGHDVNQDARRSLPLATAVDALAGWQTLLRPSSLHQHRPAPWTPEGALVACLEQITQLLLVPLHALVTAIGTGADRLALRSGQSAEYRADRFAAQVAGLDAVEGLLTCLLLADLVQGALRRAAIRGEADIWAAQRAAMAAVPADQLDRYERIGRRRLQRIDVSHPPTHYRLDLIRTLPPDAAGAPLDAALITAAEAAALITAAEAELYQWAPALARLWAP
jgi:Zn-dependent protease with chaperone function